MGGTAYTYFGKPGEEYQILGINGFGTIYESSQWFADGPSDNSEAMFNRVGAASNFGSGSAGRYILINEAGNELLEWNSFNPEFKGPWVVN